MEDKTEKLSLEIDVKSCEERLQTGFTLNSGVRSLELPLLDHRLYSFTCTNCPSDLLTQLDPAAHKLLGKHLQASLLTVNISLPFKLLLTKLRLTFSKELLISQLKNGEKGGLKLDSHNIQLDHIFRFLRARYELEGVVQGNIRSETSFGGLMQQGPCYVDLNFNSIKQFTKKQVALNVRELEITGMGLASTIQLQFLYIKRVLIPMPSPRSQTAGEAVATLTAEQSSEYDEFDEEVALISQTRRGKLPEFGENLKEEGEAEQVSGEFEELDLDEIKIETKKETKGNNWEFDTLPKDYEDERKEKEEAKASSKMLRSSLISDEILSEEVLGVLPIFIQNKSEEGEIITQRFRQQFEGILIWGLSTLQTQYASNVIPLLNYISHLKMLQATNRDSPSLQAHYANELIEAEQINALALISSRWYIQAAQLLRHIQSKLLKAVPGDNSSDGSVQTAQAPTSRSQVSPRYPISPFFAGVNRQRGGVQSVNSPSFRLLQRAAKLELLVADCTKRHGFIHQKLLSLKRFCDLSAGLKVQSIAFKSNRIYVNQDALPVLQRLHPRLIRALLKLLSSENIEQVRIASLKTIDYLLEQMGCSLDNYLIYNLRAIVKYYPKSNGLPQISGNESLFNTSIISSNSSSDLLSARSQPVRPQRRGSTQLEQDYYVKFIDNNQAFGQLLQGLFNHLLQTLLLVLSSVSSQILHQMFYEIITPYIASGALEDAPLDLQNYVLKLAQKMINICQGDLIFSPQFLSALLMLMRLRDEPQKGSGHISADDSAKEHQNRERYLQQREAISGAAFGLWQVIRMKVLPNYPAGGLDALIEWLAQNLFLISESIGEGAERQQSMTFGESQGFDLSPTPTQEMAKLNIILDAITTVARGSAFEEQQAQSIQTGGSLIIFPKTTRAELYELINPLLYWLFYSIERETRLPLFKSVWSAVTAILKSLPSSVSPSINQISLQLLVRVDQFCKTSSPSRAMLRFCDLVLSDIKDPSHELVNFLTQFLETFCECVPSSVFEQTFHVIDHLLRLCCGNRSLLTAQLLNRVIEAFVHKYTLRSKTHGSSLNLFLTSILKLSMQPGIGRSYFETLVRILLIDNNDEWEQAAETTDNINKYDLKILQNEREVLLEKLRIFLRLIASTMDLEHIPLFLQLLQNREAHHAILKLLNKSEAALKIKAHQILEAMASFFQKYLNSVTGLAQHQIAVAPSANTVLSSRNRGSMQSGQSLNTNMLNASSSLESGSLLPALRPASGNSFTDAPIQAQDLQSTGQQMVQLIQQQTAGRVITHERMLLIQLFMKTAKNSLEQGAQQGDSNLQFSALILLDTLFQQIMPAPSYQVDPVDAQPSSRSPGRRISRTQIIDIEQVDLFTQEGSLLAYEINDTRYLNIRMLSILKFWPFIESAIQSPWSNVRSICYGLVCSMLKVDLHDYRSSYQQRIRNLYQPLLLALLSGKESESKAGGLNILGSICGLSHDFTAQESHGSMLRVFRRNSEFISMPLWQQVFELQDDWDVTIREAAVVLTQLSAPRQLVKHFQKAKQENLKIVLNRIINKHRGEWEIAQSGFEQETRDPTIRPAGALISRGSSACSYISLLDIQPGFTQLGGGHQARQRQGEGEILESPTNEEVHPAFDDIFFVDRYNEAQIREIISIFRNDFKPPKNLWIERTERDSPDSVENTFTAEYAGGGDNQMVLSPTREIQDSPRVPNKLSESTRKQHLEEILEIAEEFKRSEEESKKEEEDKKSRSKSSQDEEMFPENLATEQLIFEEYRQPQKEESSNIDAEPFTILSTQEEDELGIIELGDDEVFENLDDKNIPVLRNSYANSRRPRKSKGRPSSAKQSAPKKPVKEKTEKTEKKQENTVKEAWVEQEPSKDQKSEEVKQEKQSEKEEHKILKPRLSSELPLQRSSPDANSSSFSSTSEEHKAKQSEQLEQPAYKEHDSLDDLIIKTELFDFQGNELKLKDPSPKREHKQIEVKVEEEKEKNTTERQEKNELAEIKPEEGDEDLPMFQNAALSPSLIAAAYVNHKKKKSFGGENKALSPPKKEIQITKQKSQSVPKPSHHRYPPKSARDYTPSNARLFKEINACFSVKEDPLPLTARIPKQSKKQQVKKQEKGVNKSEISGSVLTKLQKAFKQAHINTTLSPKRERKNNSLERLTGKRQASRELYSNKDVNYFVKKFEAQLAATVKSIPQQNAAGSFPSTPTMANTKQQQSKEVMASKPRKKVPMKIPPSALQYHKESCKLKKNLAQDTGSLSNTSPNIGAVLQRLNLEEDFSPPARQNKPLSVTEDDIHFAEPRILQQQQKEGHFVASPQFYSQKRNNERGPPPPQILDFYSVRPNNLRLQQQLYNMIEKQTAHRAKKGGAAKRTKKQPQQLKKESSGSRIGGRAPSNLTSTHPSEADPNMTF